jgi:DNA polymerase III subunit gamma/tau
MGYQVLARKYRPQRFADVAGQDHVTRTLLNALSQNRIAHGYIFSGHRGIGKTTIARILAMALNCRNAIGSEARPTAEPCLQCMSCREISSGGNPEAGNEATHSFDFIEIDAASNRGIDDVRSIRNQASVQPARDKYKIFLLDEAHQITEAAFNAILKTLEEPPEWTVFMMATTEPENIPQTIRSRCQHFSFHAVKFDDIQAQLKMIAGKEQVEVEDTALALLAEAGDGSMRDALSIMDQAIASAPLDEAGHAVLGGVQIRELMGSVPNAVYERLLEAVAAGQSAELMEQLNVLLNAGHSASSLARQMVRYLRNALMAKLGGEQTELLQISADERSRVARTAMLFSEEDLTRNLQIVLRTFDDLNCRQEQRFHLELGLLKLVHAQRLLPLEELLSGVAAGGGVRTGSAPVRTAGVGRGSIGGGGIPPLRQEEGAKMGHGASNSGLAEGAKMGHGASVAPAAAPGAGPSAPSISPFGSSGGGWGPSIKQSAERAPVAEPRTSVGESGGGAFPPLRQEEVAKMGHGATVLTEEGIGIGYGTAVLTEEGAGYGTLVLTDDAESARNDGVEVESANTLVAMVEAEPVMVPEAATASAPVTSSPFPAASEEMLFGFAGTSAERFEGALARLPEKVLAGGGPTAEALRQGVVSALANGGHSSASQLLGSGNWILDLSSLRIEVAGMGKKMLSLTVNAAAEKLIRQELARLGGPARFMVVAGEGGATAGQVMATPLAGSIQEEALKNPMVQRAKEIFNAEVRSVVDLRVK